MFIKNNKPGGEKWLCGDITEITGPLSHKAQMLDGLIMHSYQDPLRNK